MMIYCTRIVSFYLINYPRKMLPVCVFLSSSSLYVDIIPIQESFGDVKDRLVKVVKEDKTQVQQDMSADESEE